MIRIIPLIIVVILSCKPSAPATNETQAVRADTSVTEMMTIPGLNRLWDTERTLTTSESVLYDRAKDMLYVSCINGGPDDKKDGDGFIAMVALDGKIKNLKWVTGLSAPKGMGQSGNILYVTDIDELVSIDITNGKITNKWKVKDASFLNDVFVTEDGKVYFTDSNTSTIYSLTDDKITTVLRDSALGGTNGILIEGNTMYLAGYGSGKVAKVDMTTKVVETISSELPAGGDGVERYGNSLLVSNWNGQVYHISPDGEAILLLDSQEAKLNAADIKVIADKNLLLVPTFYGNSVTAYELIKN